MKPLDPALIAEYNQSRRCPDRRSLCHAPATSMYFGRDGSVSVCCYSRQSPIGGYPGQSIAEIWSGGNVKLLRNQMLQNILPAGCDTCADQLRARNFEGLLAAQFDHLPGPPKSALSIAKAFVTGRNKAFPLRMEFELSNKCNLECEMCSGFFSSSIRANREKRPALPMVYGREFVHQLRPYIPHLKQAKFLGGEPFLIDLYYDIWDLFMELNRACKVDITTNATVFTSKVRRVVDKIDCAIVVSLDSLQKETYERIRVNASFDRMIANLNALDETMRRRGKRLSFAACPMVSNWRELPDLLAFANSRGSTIFFNTVTHPEHLSLKYQHPSVQREVVASLRACLDS